MTSVSEEGGGPTLMLLTGLVEVFLNASQVPHASAPEQGQIDWAFFTTVALRNRWAKFALNSARSIGVTLPAQVREPLSVQVGAALAYNSAHLLTLRRLCPAFADAGISAIVIKGVLEQQRLYQDSFMRPATDVDFLVDRRRLGEARALLEAHGFTLAPECASLWWRHFLGEQHYRPSNNSMLTVDLHHRLQQPGSPSLRQLEQMPRACGIARLGGCDAQVLHDGEALLLSCASIVKALVHREPAGMYVADVAARMRLPSAVSDASERAHALGMKKLLGFGMRCARVIFDSSNASPDDETVMTGTSNATLRAMLLTPDSPAIVWPARYWMLFMLSDTPSDFLRESARRFASDAARPFLEPVAKPASL